MSPQKQLLPLLLAIVLLCGILYLIRPGGPFASPLVDPDSPSDPTTPSDPQDPTEPNEPTEPITPTDPTEPTEPSEPTQPTQPIEPTEPAEPTEPVEPYEYSCDISAYLPAITTSYSDILLVNKAHPLGESYVPENLIQLNRNMTAGGKAVQLDLTAATALEAMMLCMRADGITDVYVTSGYRSYTYQKQLQNKYLGEEMQKNPTLSQDQALAVVHTYSAPPGKSEHQSGLCVDFITAGMRGSLTNSFEQYKAFEWLQENACQFGFILRYPKDKVAVTEYSYESWHYRFVGREAAIAITQAGLTLEEYLSR